MLFRDFQPFFIMQKTLYDKFTCNFHKIETSTLQNFEHFYFAIFKHLHYFAQLALKWIQRMPKWLKTLSKMFLA